MTPHEKTRLASHVAQHRVAGALQLVAAVGAIVGAFRYGLPGFAAGALAFWLFSMAKPGPDTDLDKLTGRDK